MSDKNLYSKTLSDNVISELCELLSPSLSYRFRNKKDNRRKDLIEFSRFHKINIGIGKLIKFFDESDLRKLALYERRLKIGEFVDTNRRDSILNKIIEN